MRTALITPPTARYYVEEIPRTQILPDFECVGCRRGYFGKEPVHCTRCGGSAFEPMSRAPAKPMEASAFALRRAREELEVVARRIDKSGHRRRARILRLIEQTQERLDRAIHIVAVSEEKGAATGREEMDEFMMQ